MNKNPARDVRAVKRIKKELEKMLQEDDGTLQIEVMSESRCVFFVYWSCVSVSFVCMSVCLCLILS